MFEVTMFLLKFDMEKRAKNTPACVQTHGIFCNKWSLILHSNGLDIHNWSVQEEKVVGFCEINLRKCKNLKMTL